MAKTLDDVCDRLDKLIAFATKRAAGGAGIADDRDLDSQWGDEKIGFDPRDWVGEKFKGARMSECPADYLDMLASAYDYFAEKNDRSGAKDNKGRPNSGYDRKSAARARGWALRLRNGWTRPGARPKPQSNGAGHVDPPADDFDAAEAEAFDDSHDVPFD